MVPLGVYGGIFFPFWPLHLACLKRHYDALNSPLSSISGELHFPGWPLPFRSNNLQPLAQPTISSGIFPLRELLNGNGPKTHTTASAHSSGRGQKRVNQQQQHQPNRRRRHLLFLRRPPKSGPLRGKRKTVFPTPPHPETDRFHRHSIRNTTAHKSTRISDENRSDF